MLSIFDVTVFFAPWWPDLSTSISVLFKSFLILLKLLTPPSAIKSISKSPKLNKDIVELSLSLLFCVKSGVNVVSTRPFSLCTTSLFFASVVFILFSLTYSMIAFVVLESSLSLLKTSLLTLAVFIMSTAPPEWSASKCVRIISSSSFMPLSLRYLPIIAFACENVAFDPLKMP